MKSLILLTTVVLATLQGVSGEIAQGIKTELTLAKTHFTNAEPIIVDVYVTNYTDRDVHKGQFSPISSSVELPSFVFVRVSDGKEFSILPGLYGDDWDAWYQPASGRESFFSGDFVLPARKKIHVLHGDLRKTVVRARKYCQTALDKEHPLTNRPSYEKIVKFADEFLSGGIYDIHVTAYSTSPVVRIEMEPQKE